MGFLLIINIILLFTTAYSAPAPQGSDDVELIPPVIKNTDTENNAGFIPILVIKNTRIPPVFEDKFSFGSFFGDDEEPFGHDDNDNFPFLTSFFEDEPAAEGNDYEFPSVFSSIFDSNEEDQDEPVCGFLCTFLNDFDKRLKVLTDEVKTIHQVSNTKEDEYDVNNSTYTEKVLPDGTLVRVNKTIIHDTSEDGSSFFFHQTSYHNFGGNSDQDENVEDVSLEEEENDDKVQKSTTKFDEFPIISSSSSSTTSLPEIPELEDFPLEYEDNQTNEIPIVDESINEVAEDNDGGRLKRSDNNPWAQQSIVQNDPIIENILSTNPNWKPLHSDTLVNDIITSSNGKRGSLIRLEPETELIRRNPFTGEIEAYPPRFTNNPWNQEIID